METPLEKVPYFAAYPLKALNLPEEEYRPRIVLGSAATSKTASRIRVWPMANPYKEQDFLQDSVKEEK